MLNLHKGMYRRMFINVFNMAIGRNFKSIESFFIYAVLHVLD